MSFTYARRYTGPVRLICSDMAGSTIDFGSCAPAGAFVEIFARNHIRATLEQARKPMGLHKRDHIRMMTQEPDIAEQWIKHYGRPVTEADVERIFQAFIPLQLEVLPAFCKLIPGVAETVPALRAAGLIFTTSTGYNREMADICLRAYTAAGIAPSFSISAEEVRIGRPSPYMVHRAMEATGVFHPESVIKIGDAISDIEEGLNAGVWSVGVTVTGNMMGLNEAEFAALDAADRARRIAAADEAMRRAGAHYTVERFADLPAVIAKINERLARGERP